MLLLHKVISLNSVSNLQLILGFSVFRRCHLRIDEETQWVSFVVVDCGFNDSDLRSIIIFNM